MTAIYPFNGLSFPVLPLLQQGIREHQCKHRLGHRDDAGDNAGVVPAADRDIDNVAMDVPRGLRLCY